ncbi:MAG: hypothetical protein ACPG4T_22740, partial [Nannocystaceae bacterium]
MSSLTAIVLSTAAHLAVFSPGFDRTTGAPVREDPIKPATPNSSTSPTPSTTSPTPSPTTSPRTTPGPTPVRPRPRPRPPSSTAPANAGDVLVDNGEMPQFTGEKQPLPFESESVELSVVLQEALKHNLDLRTNAIDVAITEANIMAAIGAYDVFLTAGLNASAQ